MKENNFDTGPGSVKAPEGLPLEALDAANPLAFLAALGLFRVLTRAWPQHQPRLGWERQGGVWRPIIISSPTAKPRDVVAAVHAQLASMANHPAFTFADNLKVPKPVFRSFAENAAQNDADHIAAEFAAAFACDALTTDEGDVQDTGFRTMSGAGHQHFLAFMNQLARVTTEENLHSALFAPWRYDEQKLSMRWDPADDRRYALRWSDPSGDVIRTVRGANRLAIEALPLFPVAPVGRKVETTGFGSPYGRGTNWTWRIWETPVPLNVCRSLLALSGLQEEIPDRATLRARGIVEIYRCERITIGKFRNFTQSQAV